MTARCREINHISGRPLQTVVAATLAQRMRTLTFMNPRNQFALSALAATILFGSGCAHAPAPAAETASAEAPALPVTSAVVEAPQSTATLTISSELMAACRLDFGNLDSAPKFDFDRSTLSADDQGALRKVAECVTTGPLAGRSLALVGHADPRGDEEYNMALAASRATSAGDFLAGVGVSRGQVSESSRGKLDATGTSEDGWSRDRRVDVVLR
jgi:peptidoglycan-associated lipoprotein